MNCPFNRFMDFWGGIKSWISETIFIPIPIDIDNNELIILEKKGNCS